MELIGNSRGMPTCDLHNVLSLSKATLVPWQTSKMAFWHNECIKR